MKKIQMKKILTVIIFALVTQFAMAQKFSIKGKVVDETGSGLPAATVMILSQKDSALVSFKGTNVEGVFEIGNVSQGSYLMKITYVGYDTFFKTISSPQGSATLELGNLKLQPSSEQLNEVVITGQANAVTIKRDTIEFSAASFATGVNANVEDLLKKLPGVEVDSDGGITAQGETVQQVLVDGREFFGRDPKLATRGLPADAVKSVQVFDKKSDQARFSGVDDGVRQKTINLELKDDRHNSTFGNITAGGGADVKDSKLGLSGDEDGRFLGKASINRFGLGKQLSIIAGGNNINEQISTGGDVGGFGGGGQGAQQTGIATNYAGGINFNKDLTKKSKLTSNYLYSHSNRNLTTDTQQENIQGDLDQQNIQSNTSNNHRVNLRIDQEIDSVNSITVIANPTYTETNSTNATQSVTYSPDNSEIIRTVDQDNLTTQKNTNLTSSLLWRHRFSRAGRTLSTNAAFSYTDANLDGTLTSNNTNYGVLASPVAQGTMQKNNNQTYGVTATYTEPLGQKNNKYLEATYDFSANVNQLDKEVTNMLDGNSVITALSNKYNNTIMVNRPYASFRFAAPMYNISLGMGYQNTQLKGEFVLSDTTINYTFQNFLPAVRMNYDFTQFNRMRFSYDTRMTTPSFTQLNPVPDNSNQSNISMGNENLEPSYTHTASVNYNTFNPNSSINFSATVNANYTLNPIVNSQTTTTYLDENGNKATVRSTQPVNVKNSTNLTSNFNFGFPIAKLKSRFNVGPTARYSKGLSVNNTNEFGVFTPFEGTTEQQAYGGRAGYNFAIGSPTIFLLDLNANLNYSQTKYEVSPNQNQKFFNKVYRAQSYWKFLKSFTLNGEFTYSMTNTISSDYKLNIPMLNLSVSKLIFKNQAGEVKLGVNNVLNYSQSVQQNVDINTGSLTTTTYTNLARYFMLSFTYALNKNLDPSAGRSGVRVQRFD